MFSKIMLNWIILKTKLFEEFLLKIEFWASKILIKVEKIKIASKTIFHE